MEDKTDSTMRIAALSGAGDARVRLDGLLGRNFLEGMQNDAINALICGAGHNMRKILAKFRLLRFWLAALLVISQEPKSAPQAGVEGFVRAY